jgi:hypothetical protein
MVSPVLLNFVMNMSLRFRMKASSAAQRCLECVIAVLYASQQALQV